MHKNSQRSFHWVLTWRRSATCRLPHGDSSCNWSNWLENGLGTVTDRSPTNSKSNFHCYVASPQLVGDLSDGTILLLDPCAIKYVTKAQQDLYWNRNSHTSYLNSRLYIKYNQTKNNFKPKYGLFVFSFKDSLDPILSKFVVNWRGAICH